VHVVCAAFLGVPTIEVSIASDGRGLTKFCRSARPLSKYSCSLVTLAGPVAETKFSGDELIIPIASIWDALGRFQNCQGRT
jgi:hypothetical protein